MAPNTLVKVMTSLAAPLSVLTTPLIFAASVSYDLLAIALGQHQLAAKVAVGLGGGGGEGWSRLLAGLGFGTLAIVGARAYGGARWF